MKAMRIHTLGEPMVLENVADPVPGKGEVLLRVKACGVNFADTLMVQGKYQEKPELPFSPGMELCGVVEDGNGTHLKTGMRVATMAGHGGFAERVAVPAMACIPVPDGMPDPHAAAFMIAYGTSHVGLDYKAGLKSGETLLVLGAAGGVGLTAVEIGKLMGATVIACARGTEKGEIARAAGADHVIDSDTDDIREAVKALGGADVVYDPVGGEQFTAALRACKPEARLLPLGFASGEIPQIPANLLLVKNLSVIGFYWGGYVKFKPQVIMSSIQTLFGWYAEGKIKPHISHALPLAQAGEALDLLRSRKATGKVIVTID